MIKFSACILMLLLFSCEADAALTIIGNYDTPDYARSVAIAGNYAYVADGNSGLRIANVANPASPVPMGSIGISYALDVAVAGNFAYMTTGSDGLRTILIVNPASPVLAGFYNTPAVAESVALAGNYAYVADGPSGLWVINIANPGSPAPVGFYDSPDYAFGVAVSGSYAYVADAASGLRVINVVNPASPVPVGFYDTSGTAYGVTVAGSYAYVADGNFGLRIIDITNPASPTEVGFYDTPGVAHDVVVVGNYAYVADGSSGLRVVNIANPASPTEVAFYDTPGFSEGVAVAGSYIYLTDSTYGLQILADVTCIDGYKLDTFGGKLSGWTVFVDRDNDGVLDPGEPSDSTDANGYWQICGLLAGESVNVTEVSKSGWIPFNPPVGWQTVTVQPSDGTGYVNITNQNVTCIDGYKLDTFGNKLSGWTIFVDRDIDGIFDPGEPSDSTDINGYWRICGLKAGESAKVTEVPQTGWTAFNPLAGWQTFTVQPSNGSGYINFTNSNIQSLNEDLSVSKVAMVNGIAVTQVNPGQIFNYNITVMNKDLINEAPLVVVTDKLPYDVEYIGSDVYPATPADYTINQSGDLIYVRFDQMAAGSTRYINITVKAPSQAPTTLYNIVNLRYRDDQNTSDNSMTISTYVVQLGYNQTEAAFSFEDLLHNQTQLLFQFEDLLHTIPATPEENYTFLVSFEQLLRSQAALTSSFEDLLTNESNTGWDTEYSEENRTALLWSYEQMLYDEAFLFASFNMKIQDSWQSMCNETTVGHTQNMQTELTASFEDLLKRQTRLYKSFDLLLNKINTTDHNELVDFLAAYENLLRMEANLFMSFNELVDQTFVNECIP